MGQIFNLLELSRAPIRVESPATIHRAIRGSHSSVGYRQPTISGLGHLRPDLHHDSATSPSAAAWLSPFELSEANNDDPVPAVRASNKGCLPMSFSEYLQLLDWTGRQVREDKPGAIPTDLAPVLERLQLSHESWLNPVHDFRRKFRRAAGTPESLSKEAQQRGCQKMQGIVHSRQIFNPPPGSTA